ncbi:TonB-dependent receptor plug domain-containing protein [Colwellia piezophila]|uniref:TonB-dependent receptor plug domain-containing protein n=1 Tax=Colwellia piezophila TaxID=211668 RepID=UPI0003A2307C|nr:TonB-dependent receptor [Colwellia piezophila]
MFRSAHRNAIPTITLGLTLLSTFTVNADDSTQGLFSLSLSELLEVKVTTVSKREESAKTAPGSIIVITDEDIKLRGYRHLRDILADIPGFSVLPQVTQEWLNYYTVRGITGQNKFVILQNGIRVHSPTGRNQAIDSGFSLYAIKQVEIMMGPTSALYGADAMTAIVNLVTYDDPEESADFISITVGENNNSSAEFFVSKALGDDSAIFIGGHSNKNDHQDLTKEYHNYYTPVDLTTFSGTTVLQASERNSMGYFKTESESIFVNFHFKDLLKIGFNHRSEGQSNHIGSPVADENIDEKAFWTMDYQNVYIETNIAIGDVHSNTQISYAQYELAPDSGYANIFVNFASRYKYERGNEFEINQNFNIDISEKTQIDFGFSYENFYMLPKTTDLAQPFNPDRPVSTQSLVYLGTDLPIKIFELNYNNLGFFTQWRQQWLPSLSSTLGLRYDNSSIYGDTTNPRLGIVYQSSEKMTWKYIYSTAFIAASPAFSYEHYGSFAFQDDNDVYQSFFMNIPNPDLKPEEMTAHEINLNYQLDSSTNIFLNIYKQEVSNLISSGATNPQQPLYISGGEIAFTQSKVNAGEISNHGFDAGFRLRRQISNWQADYWLYYSYVDGELNDERLPLTVDHMIKSGLTLSKGNWYITPTIIYRSETSGGPGSTVEIDDLTLVNLIAGVEKLPLNLSASLRVNNLFDKKHFSAHGATEGVPQETRTIEFKLTLVF